MGDSLRGERGEDEPAGRTGLVSIIWVAWRVCRMLVPAVFEAGGAALLAETDMIG
jgi:hypothetical protein